MIFCDFDGTITRQDVVDVLLETHAEPRWRGIEEEWINGRITSRQCLDRQMACVRVTAAALDELIDSIDIDEGFQPLASWARDCGFPLVVFSDGFDWIIERLFATNNIDVSALGIRIFASHLDFVSGVPKWNFPHSNGCSHGCGTCKPAIIQRLMTPDAVSVVIGDGRSDVFAVDGADVVYAKRWLQGYCEKRGIPFQAFRNLADVLAHLNASCDPIVVRTTL
jgi:2-hydroxy-3-keto-5-methylthiopentenyl-1-phosphate phosphatase